MDGYRDETGGYSSGVSRRFWRLEILGVAVAYILPLLLLWSATGFPDSLGVHISTHGKSRLLENWYYSSLLLRRHSLLDLITFLYMWAPILGLVGWLAFKLLR